MSLLYVKRKQKASVVGRRSDRSAANEPTNQGLERALTLNVKQTDTKGIGDVYNLY